MPDDIVTRLRAPAWPCICVDAVLINCVPCNTRLEAADEIERLRAANAALRFQLADIRREIDHDPAKCALPACQRCDPWEARHG